MSKKTANELDCKQLSEFFRVFSNPIRLKILCALSEGERNIGAIAEEAGASKYYVSQQVRLLRLMNLVTQRREGQYVYCAIKQKSLLKALKAIAKEARAVRISSSGA